MSYFTTFGELQQELREHSRMGQKLQFPEAIDDMYLKHKLHELPPAGNPRLTSGNMSPESFAELVDEIAFPVNPSNILRETVFESDVIPMIKDVFVIRHPRYTRPYLHRHDYVEIDYVISGSCKMYFEAECMDLSEQDLCVIAPGSRHDIEITDESTVYCIMIRKSTFETTLFSLLSRNDALSLFFRNSLKDGEGANYILFHANKPDQMRIAIQNAMIECHKQDDYANSCCVSWINLLLSSVLRSHSNLSQYRDNQGNVDFTYILQYIRRHYQTVTLPELADFFHYSKPHLCTLIKLNTGVSFTDLVKKIRMSRATEYLLNTSLSVTEIGETIGYNSSDHFSRVFRSTYSCSPREYRRIHAAEVDHFVPFETEELKVR